MDGRYARLFGLPEGSLLTSLTGWRPACCRRIRDMLQNEFLSRRRCCYMYFLPTVKEGVEGLFTRSREPDCLQAPNRKSDRNMFYSTPSAGSLSLPCPLFYNLALAGQQNQQRQQTTLQSDTVLYCDER